jgi:hypothetical protein
LITHDPLTNEYALIIVEVRPWANTARELGLLRQKLDNYAAYIETGLFVQQYPEAAGNAVRIQIDCVDAPTGAAADMIAESSRRLAMHNIRTVVNLLT